jgi:nitrate reductase gamma subunit
MNRKIMLALSAFLVLVGFSLFIWLSYEPSDVAAVLGVSTMVDEAGVVLAGLAVVLACFGTAFTLHRRAHLPATAV